MVKSLLQGLKDIKGIKWLRVLTWISIPFFSLFCLLMMDYMNFGGHMFYVLSFGKNHLGSLLFEVLIVLLIFVLLILLTSRIGYAAILFGTASVIFSYINYTKVALNGDHFFPQDIAMIVRAKELASFVSGDLPKFFLPCLIVIILWITLFLIMQIELRGYLIFRWVTVIVLVAMVYGVTNTPEKSEKLLNYFGMSPVDAVLQSSNYEANGFVGAFTLNVLGMRIPEPSGYTQNNIEEILSEYDMVFRDEENENPDVILVLSESFFDARVLPGVSFSDNPLVNYDYLCQDEYCQSGYIYTTAVGGGTVRPEFSILTGMTTDYLSNIATPYSYIEQEIPTYVSNYKNAGYKTLAIHPYDKKFYSRDRAYPFIGFDEFYGQEDIEQLMQVSYKRDYVSDATTAKAIMQMMEKQSVPTFIFAITMENHQPYLPLEQNEILINVESNVLSQPSYDALTTYVQGLADADRMLGELANWVEQRERPTALIFFGDHLPTLGSNYLAYNETGFFNTADGMDTEERQKMYSTPFLIYSNFELKEGLFSATKDIRVSDYNLMNHIAKATGMEFTPYMELLSEFYDVAPYYNVRLLLEETSEIRPYVKAMELITYDRIMGKGWSY